MKQEINKIIHPADMDVYGRGNGRKYPIYCKIEHRDDKLSITGVIAPTCGGNAGGGCGQIDMEFEHRNPKHNDKGYGNLIKPSDLRFAAGWTTDKWFTFLEYWKLYHLNDLQAGCVHQRSANNKKYCKICKYEYGSAWKSLIIPDKVIEFLSLLPETNRTPAWI